MALWRQLGSWALLTGVLVFGLGAGCSGGGASAQAKNPQISEPIVIFDENRAWDDLETQLTYGPRVPGTEGHVNTREWLVARLKAQTDDVTLQPFAHLLGGENVRMWNILARFTGTGAAPREHILLAAHWDTRPTADYDPDPAKRNTPIDGANDGASGVAVLLEIARQLKAHPIARDVTIILFDGEDYGPKVDNMLLGSKYYAKNLPNPKPSWGILLDMIGDADLSVYREPNSDKYAKAVNDRVFTAATRLGYLRAGTLSGFVNAPYRVPVVDDHMPLNEAGVPMVDLIDFDYPPWHTTADTADKCSPKSLKLVGKTVLYAIQMP
ncbi:MAG: Aminopeptidase YwaD precursor [bacterium ADurb.Bin429]|nr:MAG: Aminopeptidase YwaD precursor [bacterium ADurb.Bin429]